VPLGLELVLVALCAACVGALVGWRFGRSESSIASSSAGSDADDSGWDGELGAEAHAVLELLRSATVVLRRDGAVVQASAEAHAYGLVADGQLVRGPLRDLVDEAVVNGEVQDVELEVPQGRFGQRTRVLAVRVAPLGAALVLLLAEDQTDARRVEAVRRDFVVNVSHELKTPIGALSLLAETLDQASDDPETVRRFAARIQKESARLTTLVTEILELSRLQVAGSLVEANPVSLDGVVTEAVDRARTAAGARDIEVEVGGERGAEVFGDRDLLVTAVRNLIDNAVAYSEPGTRVAVGVTVRGSVVELAVVDQGIGIAAADLPRLFERFYRVDPARSRDTGGTGLGLSIVKHVVAEHGGEVTVWSQPGRGSTFTIRLPALVNEGSTDDLRATSPAIERSEAGPRARTTDTSGQGAPQ
jgi:two-component system, OmpR family, sensor histidine kinase SenX3